jgi:hypothetical protein
MSLNVVSGAIAGLVLLITMTALKRLKNEHKRRKFRQLFNSKHYRRIFLLKRDIELIGGNYNISTLTVFKGVNFPVATLRNKVREILKKNLWLCCRLMTDNTHQFVAVCPTEYSESFLNEHFIIDMDRSIDSDLDYCALMKDLEEEVLVKPSAKSVDTDTPRFRITICKSKSGGFTMCVSLCHVIADGATFYRLYGMLSESAEVCSLVPARVMAFDEEVKRNLIFTKIPHSPLALASIVKLIMFGHSFNAKTYVVDEQWVARRKTAVASSVSAAADSNTSAPFVSTNDILTSWLCVITEVDFAGMAVNFRNRMLDITSDHVGNYVELVLYRRADCAHPLQIRRSLATFKSESNTFLTAWEQWEWNGLVLTNWASLYEDVQLEGCEHVCHLPLVSGLPPFRHAAIMYCPRKGETAVFLASRSNDVFGRVEASAEAPLRVVKGPTCSE